MPKKMGNIEIYIGLSCVARQQPSGAGQTTNDKRQTKNDKRQTKNNKRRTTNDKRQTKNDKRQTKNNKRRTSICRGRFLNDACPASLASYAGWPDDEIEGKHDSMEGTYIYLLQSLAVHDRRYVGLTRNLETRLKEHNTGMVESTWRHKPWKLVASIWFADRDRAEAFEIYLKHGSGHAFAKRHFW